MDFDLYAKCTYNQQTIMFFLTPTLLFSDVVTEVSSRFAGLTPDSFNMSCSLPRYPNCALSNDNDLKLMIRSMLEENVACVDIIVKDYGESSIDVSSTRASFDAASSTISVDSTDVLDSNSYLGCFRLEAPRSYLSNEWRGFISHVNQKFEGGASDFRDKLKKFTIETGFDFQYFRNHRDCIVAHCSQRSQGCLWTVRARKNKVTNFFYIKKLNNIHTCQGVLRQQKSKYLGSHTIKTIITHELKGNPSLKPKDIISSLKNSYGLDVSYRNAWYGKLLATRSLHGNESGSYSHMAWYRDSVMATNPDSYCILETNPMTSRFERFFLCFGGCIKGFMSCVPILFVDAAHLKSKYKGYMLCATGKNGNEEFYPFAFAVVDSENKENWQWFFEHLHHILSPQDRTITFFTDRHDGLLDAVATVFPDSPHSYCYYHLKQNVMKCYEKKKGNYDVDLIVHHFMAVSYSPTIASYHYNLHKLLTVAGEPIKPLLKRLVLEKWCNAFFKRNRYGEMSNSVAECFNNWTRELREFPIFDMFEKLRVKLMENMADRKIEAEKWTTFLCPKVEEQLQSKMNVGRHWSVYRSSPTIFDVHAEKSVTVDLGNYTCSCRHWQIDSFPCSHALAAIQRIGNVSVYGYIESFYQCQSYKDAYAHGIHPIPNIEKFYHDSMSTAHVVNPPLTRIPSGRPKTVRIKSTVEGKKTRPMTCTRCSELGRHNKKTCKKVIC